MAKNLLFEIGTEEMPAHFMPDTLVQLKSLAEKNFTENRIEFKNINTYGTPRRIVLYIEGLEESQKDLDQSVKGPSKKAAYDDNMQPTKALQGFLNSQGAAMGDITIEKVSDVEYIFINKHVKGSNTDVILKTLLPELISSLTFPKSMRWRNYDIRFARPIRWLVSVYENQVIEFNIEGTKSSNITKGHRTLSNKDITINNANEYFDVLRKEFVIVNQEERKDIILKQIIQLAEGINGKALIDQELLEEVIYLIEYPQALVGSFEDEFLKLPKEAVITPMKEHQRYFPVVDKNSKLMPYFIAIRNGNDYFINLVKVGNERVLRARLKDAQFFYNEDLKVKLEDRIESLKTIVYQEKLGTIYEKVERIVKISEFIASEIGLGKEQIEILKRAVMLSKTDLVTNMVNEFDELQGVAGREYAKIFGEKPEVCEAIFSHYLPKNANDETPKDIYGQVISISDKLDSVVGSFSINVQPTGSQDPYGLRRQTIGIIKVIMDNKLNIDISRTIKYAIECLKNKATVEESKLYEDLDGFFKQRLKIILTDSDYRYDVIDSILNAELSDINIIKNKADVLTNNLENDKFKELLAALTRVYNISKKGNSIDINKNLFKDKFEAALYEKFEDKNSSVEAQLNDGNYDGAISELYLLTGPINDFFDNVMVMDENQDIRNNRLALLKLIADLSFRICDFSKLVAN